MLISVETTMAEKAQRMAGKVDDDGLFPDRGFFWIRGSDGERYFAHQTKVVGGFLILDMWDGQDCTFVPNYDDERGPRATQVQMSERA